MIDRLRVLLVVAALVVGVVCPAAAFFVGEDTLPTTLLLLWPTRAWLVTAAVCAFFVVVAAKGVGKFAAVAPVVVVGVVTFPGAGYFDANVKGVRVAAWNLAKGQAGTQQELIAGLRALHADVVCVSEAGDYDWQPGFNVQAIAKDVGAVVVGSGETRALSWLPVVRQEERSLAPGPARRPLVVVDVDKDGAVYRVGCVHLMPRLLFIGDSIDRGDARTGSWSTIAATARAQGRALRDAVQAAGVDVVAGDFNNQPWGKSVRDIEDVGYVDALAGEGPGVVTLGHGVIAKRIDQVLVSSRRFLKSAAIVDVSGSDHRAVVVEFGPPPSTGR